MKIPQHSENDYWKSTDDEIPLIIYIVIGALSGGLIGAILALLLGG